MRKMATIRIINSIRPIVDADAIECAIVGGWTVVVKKNEFAAGDFAVYCEIDSFIPSTIAPYLTKPGQYAKTFNDVEGERLRTVRLRGQLSQGLLLPITTVGHTVNIPTGKAVVLADMSIVHNGHDVSELLGIVKFEPAVPAHLAGEVKGLFPSRIPKTDQERIQNLTAELEEWKSSGLTWEITEKLDGSSMTVYRLHGEIGVCSRNLDLKYNLENSLWRAASAQSLPDVLEKVGRDIAIQGELIGNGIQGNKYKLRDQSFHVYDIYDIEAGRYFTPAERLAFVTEHNIKHVPIFEHAKVITMNVKELLDFAEGNSVVGEGSKPIREGVVYKCNEEQVSFKAINNTFLLKNGD